jgi:hypothetical protein
MEKGACMKDDVIWTKEINNNVYQIIDAVEVWTVKKNGIDKAYYPKRRGILNLLRKKIERGLYE